MSVRYARGRRAYGMCARSGRRMLLRDMVEDPFTGLLVDPAWAEPPLMRPPTDIIDAIALRRPTADLDHPDSEFVFGSSWALSADAPAAPLALTVAMTPPTITVT